MNRLIGCLSIFNEAEFIERCLRFTLAIADELIIIDGPYADYPHDSPHSTDGTVEIIEKFMAEQSKPIALVSRSDAWPNQITKRNTYVKMVDEGDLMLVIDGDQQPFLLGDAKKQVLESDAVGFIPEKIQYRPYILQIKYGNPRIIRKIVGLHYGLNHYSLYDAEGIHVYDPPYKMVRMYDCFKILDNGTLRNPDKMKLNSQFYSSRIEYANGFESFLCESCGADFKLKKGEAIKCPLCKSLGGSAKIEVLDRPTKEYAHDFASDKLGVFKFYNEIAEKYPETKMTFQCPLGEMRAQAAVNALSEDGLVLDLGCHDGYLAPRIKNYVGLDIALPALKRMSKPRVWADAQQIPFKDKSFNCIVCLEVLEHVYSHEDVIAECSRILKGGGKLVLSVPYGNNPWAFTQLKDFENYGISSRPYLHGTFNEEYMSQMLCANGFQIEKMAKLEGCNIMQVVASKKRGL